MIWETHPPLGNVLVAYPDFLDWRAQRPVGEHCAFDDIAAYTFQGLQKENLTGDGEPDQLKASLISANIWNAACLASVEHRSELQAEGWAHLGRGFKQPRISGCTGGG